MPSWIEFKWLLDKLTLGPSRNRSSVCADQLACTVTPVSLPSCRNRFWGG